MGALSEKWFCSLPIKLTSYIFVLIMSEGKILQADTYQRLLVHSPDFQNLLIVPALRKCYLRKPHSLIRPQLANPSTTRFLIIIQFLMETDIGKTQMDLKMKPSYTSVYALQFIMVVVKDIIANYTCGILLFKNIKLFRIHLFPPDYIKRLWLLGLFRKLMIMLWTHDAVFVNGATFWLGFSSDYIHITMCFDTKTEIWREIVLPDWLNWSVNHVIHPFGQSFGYFVDDHENHFDMGVLKGDSMNEYSWEKKMSVSTRKRVKPVVLGLRNNGEPTYPFDCNV
ncbi:hypothetical protein POM88_037484 [Heracleum sosnowskyi]|uniref:Uncharacterized protein n=1 Tax=Heracleum sosnowskyi TaxID=360622 RepID=A0AAD8HQ73_9APIA|nr:hypothetical protein POM88_037484 [Heracleum sosnowskyi]